MANRLLEMAQFNLEKLAEMDKEAFEPMLGGQQASAAPQGAPIDPSMAGGQGDAPVDPSAAGGMPAVGSPPPAAATAAPSAPPTPPPMDPAIQDQLIQAVRQVMQETGGMQGTGNKGKSGQDVEERLGAIEAALAQVLETLNLASPQQAVADAVSSAGKAKADVMSSGSGVPADAGMSVPAMGPMDPNAGQALSDMKVPNTVGGIKMGSANNRTRQLANVFQKARSRC